MLPNTYFESKCIPKYLTMFGSLFANIRIERSREPGDEKTQHYIVPIAHGGREKYIARNTTDPNIERPVAAQLPRMSYEMVDFMYDPKRQFNPIGQRCFMPAPYTFVFKLYITARHVLDAVKIVEQIAPFFRPTIGIRADILDNDSPWDLKLTLSDTDMQDNYEGNMEERRILIWTLTFTLDAFLVGPTGLDSDNYIRWVTVNTRDFTTGNTAHKANTYPVMDGVDLNDIQPSDPYIIVTDITEFYDD